MEKVPINLKVVRCMANEYTFWQEWQPLYKNRLLKMGIAECDLDKPQWESRPPKTTLTIGKEYKVLKIDNQGAIVIEDDFGVKQRRSRKYFKQSVKEPKKVQKLSIKKKVVKVLCRFLNGL